MLDWGLGFLEGLANFVSDPVGAVAADSGAARSSSEVPSPSSWTTTFRTSSARPRSRISPTPGLSPAMSGRSW